MEDLKASARRLFLETLDAITPRSAIREQLSLDEDTLRFGANQVSLDRYKEVVLIGLGKASLEMGAAVEELLSSRVKRGMLVTDRRSRTSVKSEVLVAGHPLPDENSLLAGKKITELVESCSSDSLIIFLISGGGSSLVERSRSAEITLDDLRATNRILVGCGASIHEINIVRKQLSTIKGGQLGWLARKSTIIGLYLSDVNPGDPRSIASNPILPDDVLVADLHAVVNKFKLMDQLPNSVARVIELADSYGFGNRAAAGPKPLAFLLLDNSSALKRAGEIARRDGFRVEVDSALMEGDYQTIGDQLLQRLCNLKSLFPSEPVCLLSGGEVSCSVRGSGIGGRNQEFVLYCAARLARSEFGSSAAVLSCGTDGIDGNSTAAGAVADSESLRNGARYGLDPTTFISASDSHLFFRSVGGLVVTGPTGNNVRDLRILIAQ